MDRLIYTAMSGAKQAFVQQAAVAHNIANVSTAGYRSQEHRFRAVPVQSEALPTRAFVADATVGSSFVPGPLMTTGRPLDVALQGKGWIVVEPRAGGEALTRGGSLSINANGQLQTMSGLNVLGDGGPISIPPDTKISIAPDGTISTVPESGAKNAVSIVGRIKLVNPPEAELVRGEDGLFRVASGESSDIDENLRLAGETLEGSNVSVVDAMVSMISLSRQFELQIRMLQNADQNARQASQILSMNR